MGEPAPNRSQAGSYGIWNSPLGWARCSCPREAKAKGFKGSKKDMPTKLLGAGLPANRTPLWYRIRPQAGSYGAGSRLLRGSAAQETPSRHSARTGGRSPPDRAGCGTEIFGNLDLQFYNFVTLVLLNRNNPGSNPSGLFRVDPAFCRDSSYKPYSEAGRSYLVSIPPWLDASLRRPCHGTW